MTCKSFAAYHWYMFIGVSNAFASSNKISHLKMEQYH